MAPAARGAPGGAGPGAIPGWTRDRARSRDRDRAWARGGEVEGVTDDPSLRAEEPRGARAHRLARPGVRPALLAPTHPDHATRARASRPPGQASAVAFRDRSLTPSWRRASPRANPTSRRGGARPRAPWAGGGSSPQPAAPPATCTATGPRTASASGSGTVTACRYRGGGSVRRPPRTGGPRGGTPQGRGAPRRHRGCGHGARGVEPRRRARRRGRSRLSHRGAPGSPARPRLALGGSRPDEPAATVLRGGSSGATWRRAEQRCPSGRCHR